MPGTAAELNLPGSARARLTKSASVATFIGAGARTERNDEADGLLRPSLRLRLCRGCRQGENCSESDEGGVEPGHFSNLMGRTMPRTLIAPSRQRNVHFPGCLKSEKRTSTA